MQAPINFSPFPLLITERLVLRELNINDRNEIHLLRSDEKVNQFLERPASTGLHDAQSFIEKIIKSIAENKSVYWVITLKEKDRLIGTLCLYNISVEKCIGELGYELHPDYQGKGIMQEAITKVIDYCFNKMKLKTITAVTHPGNIKSVKLLLKNNFLPDKNYKYVNSEDAAGLTAYYLQEKN